MVRLKALIFAFQTTLLFLSACGDGHDGHVEIITLGPYKKQCYGAHGERDCLMQYHREEKRWGFFFDGVEGFDFEPGFIYTLKVRLEDRGPYIQDVGRYSYHLVEIIEKKKAPDNFNYDSDF